MSRPEGPEGGAPLVAAGERLDAIEARLAARRAERVAMGLARPDRCESCGVAFTPGLGPHARDARTLVLCWECAEDAP